MNPAIDRHFAGSIPQLYEQHLVPLIFEPYAIDLAARAVALDAHRLLEIAAGTGVVTRRLVASLAAGSHLVASDLNLSMLSHADAIGTSRPIDWCSADALALPFEDRAFDAVLCQFGAMFFPDKPRAFAEARRVLRPKGVFAFSVWDRIEENEFALVVIEALAKMFPADPPRFLARTPHGYHDLGAIANDLAAAGFVSPPRFETIAFRSRAASPLIPATAYCQGTPLRGEIEARDRSRLAEATNAAASAIAHRFGTGTVDGKIQAHLITVEA